MVKNSPASAGDMRDLDSVAELGRSLGGEGMATTPRFLYGESHGQRNLVGCSP